MIQRGDGDGGNGFANNKGDEETAKIENKRCCVLVFTCQLNIHATKKILDAKVTSTLLSGVMCLTLCVCVCLAD